MGGGLRNGESLLQKKVSKQQEDLRKPNASEVRGGASGRKRGKDGRPRKGSPDRHSDKEELSRY